ncbi:MAG: hypothetical protein ACXW00_13180, partial [Methylobacter sp.]
LNQAATLLSLGNNEDRLALLKHHHGALHESIREMSREDLNYQALTSQIKKSTQVLERLGQGTPLLAYVNQKGSIDIFPKKPTREELRQIISKIR